MDTIIPAPPPPATPRVNIAIGGEHRIEGCPGAGKSTTLAALIKEAEGQYGRDNIVVASFTKTAAVEIASRGIPVPPAQVGTLHALAFRALGVDPQQVAEGPEVMEAWAEANPRMQLSGTPVGDEGEVTGKGAADRVARQVQVLRSRLIPKAQWPAEARAFDRAWEDFKQDEGLVDFVDMIQFALHDTSTPVPGARIAFFDEAQDFTPLDFKLAHHWGANMDAVVFAGDTDQLLYAHNGADGQALLTPIEPERLTFLERSYRVPRKAASVAQRWIEQVQQRQPKVIQPKGEEGELDVLSAATWRNPKHLVRSVLADLDAGLTPMVLASAGYMLHPLMGELRAAGVPWHNPYRVGDPGLNPLSGGEGIPTTRRLLAFLKPLTDEGMWTEREVFWWAEHLRSRGVMVNGAKAHLEQATNSFAGAYTPLLVEALAAFFELESFEALRGALGDEALMLRWLEARLLRSHAAGWEFAINILRRHGREGLKRKPSLILGTIHSVKGGEADSVYLIPDLSQAGERSWRGSRKSRDAVVRQMYVALTRTRGRFTLLGNASFAPPLAAAVAGAVG